MISSCTLATHIGMEEVVGTLCAQFIRMYRIFGSSFTHRDSTDTVDRKKA